MVHIPYNGVYSSIGYMTPPPPPPILGFISSPRCVTPCFIAGEPAPTRRTLALGLTKACTRFFVIVGNRFAFFRVLKPYKE